MIDRKMRGGLTRQQAEEFYQITDGPNVLRVLGYSLPTDMHLYMDKLGEYHFG